MAPPPSNQFQAPMAPPSNFNPEEDCKILRKAVHGMGTDERAIINIIVNRNLAQRQEIRRAYKACFGKDLIKRLQEDTSGNFKQVISAMFMTPAEYDAYCLYKAMKGIGTNEGVLIEIIGTRNNQEMQMIKNEFQKNYGKSLESWVKSETSGHFRKLLISLIQASRSMNTVPNPQLCQSDAQALYRAGEGRWGTDESTFVRIFTQRSAAEMDLINNCYQQLRGKSLHQAIDNEFSGDTNSLLHTILEGLQDPAAYFARRLRESVQGVGTNDSRLVRVIVSRCEVDMPRIKQAYQRLFGRDLVMDVRSDTSGNYKKILTHLLTRV
jgi:predicted lipid carrier protein YhbT